MSSDMEIKVVKVDYIPENKILCNLCEYWDICPVDYVCETLERLLEKEFSEDKEV